MTEPTAYTRLLIVIPAYNEEANILRVLQGIRETLPQNLPYDILVVNDGSTDKTGKLLETEAIHLITHPIRSGYGTTLQTAYKFAARNSYGFLIQIDGDGQHHPAYIAKIYEMLRSGASDVVIGSRFLPTETPHPDIAKGEVYKGTFLRRIGMGIFATIASLLTGRTFTDPTSGYIGFNRKAFSYLTNDIYPTDYPDADVIIMLVRKGFTVKETPVLMLKNPEGGTLHRGLKPLYYLYKMFLSILVTLLRKH